jgi:hypothetical protein
MFSPLLNQVRLVVASSATLMLASCALPPRQAWQQIQTKGLLSYYMGGESRPLGVASHRTQALTQNTAPVPTNANAALVGPTVPSTPPPSMLNSASMPVAQSVLDLPGYVRTPFTSPPRLVDVRGMSAGSKVVCPYTQRPFLVPGSVSSGIASAPSRPQAPVPQERPRTTPVAPDTSVAAMSKPNTTTPITPAVTAAPTQAAPELPYGSSISGRPGFVNSPYAAKHQLVDVTGLPVGMEVKCPYTGKLFRVPPQ